MKKRLLLAIMTISATLTACSVLNKSEPQGQAPATLAGTSWELMTEQKADGNCNNLPPSMEFTRDNRVAGDLGCNYFNGSYSLDGKNIRFDQVATTRRLCDSQSMEMEERLLKLLNNARFVTQSEEGLSFWDESGHLLERYEQEKSGTCR